MYLTDPTLYGATLPQRDLAMHTPFYNGMFAPWQELPITGMQRQDLQVQGMPWQPVPIQALPWQQIPLQALPVQQYPIQTPPWRQFVPQAYPQPVTPFQHAAAPFYKTAPNYTAPYMTPPFAPTGHSSYLQGNYCNVPFYGLQRPW